MTNPKNPRRRTGSSGGSKSAASAASSAARPNSGPTSDRFIFVRLSLDEDVEVSYDGIPHWLCMAALDAAQEKVRNEWDAVINPPEEEDDDGEESSS